MKDLQNGLEKFILVLIYAVILEIYLNISKSQKTMWERILLNFTLFPISDNI